MTQIPSKLVLVSLVTCDDAHFLERCLQSVKGQTVPVRVKIFDNASRDDTCEIAEKCGAELFQSDRNLGFSYGHNRNLWKEDFETALLLNADVILAPNYLEQLLIALEEVEGAGMAGGKLYRMDSRGQLILRRSFAVLDSTGIFFTPSQRHFDRGSGREDHGQYNRRQLVFGITGAALFCKKAMLEDVSVRGECLDEDFFVYREDADLAWRAQLRGWKAVYEPRAKARHHRYALSSRRRQLSPLINYHSLKNRYLMRTKNLDSAVRRKCFPYLWLRDIVVFGYVLCLEWSSLPAYWAVWGLRSKFQQKRKLVQDSRQVSPEEIAWWFSFQPRARDCDEY